MREIIGSLWDYHKKPGFVVCITTNGNLNRKNENIMGKGIALEAKKRIPDLPFRVGELITDFGNTVNLISDLGVLTFPTKINWWEKSDLSLITQSTNRLNKLARLATALTFCLPRPGCGNGGRDWETEIKPIVSVFPDNVWIISQSGK